MQLALMKNMAAIYSALLVKAHFIELSDKNLAQAATNASRANLCELLAVKLLRRFSSSRIELAAALTASWSPLSGAPIQLVNTIRLHETDISEISNTLEIAIATSSKRFLSTPLVQTIISDIYSGRLVLSIASTHSLLADNYKIRAVEIYDVSKAPFLDHYRYFITYLHITYLFLCLKLESATLPLHP
jgi:hypothetical protein